MGWGFIVEGLAAEMLASLGTRLAIVRARAVHGLGGVNIFCRLAFLLLPEGTAHASMCSGNGAYR